ncbi:hypothetical protein LWI28_004132 [Acer negundo]|uniref:Ubiquitin-like domain-containing protein n=1 Tax=Acer negundo TaxID=4023 RepID=A0AAD5JD71_ACENE|nr:hypothetical protein LWI28_004132 [Acer negundo]
MDRKRVKIPSLEKWIPPNPDSLKFNVDGLPHEKEGILEDRQVLSFDGRRLEHDYRILDNDIPNKSIIQLSEKSQRLKLYFRIPSNENNFKLEADNNEEFCGIKSIMQSKLGIPKDKYTIYYAGEVVENHQTVASLNIQSAEAILQMVSNPKDLLLFSVETPTKGKKEIKVKWTFTVLDVKKLVESMTNYHSEDWDLFSLE